MEIRSVELKFKLFFIVGVLWSSSASSAVSLDSLKAEKKRGRWVVHHQVEQGETLYSLGRRYGSDIDRIVKENDLLGNQLSVGQVILIPVEIMRKPEKSVSKKEEFHLVKTGETLFSISRLYQTTVDELKVWNALDDINIEVGQFLRIVAPAELIENQSLEESLIEDTTRLVEFPREKSKVHIVAPGETLFSLSRKYGVTVDEIKAWNHMSDPSISVGQQLFIGSGRTEIKIPEKQKEAPAIPDGFEEYQVQTGETMESVSSKFHTIGDSVIAWNQLTHPRLVIGQKILLRTPPDSLSGNSSLSIYKPRRRTIDEKGFARIYEEGVAMRISERIDTRKYLALHRTLPIGTLLEVRNLMNNQKIFVRVVGKLPPTGLNENVLIRLSPVCFDRLGIIDPRTRVEISYYEE